jgi:hypothetical protein
MIVEIGPVASSAALVWLANTRSILRAIEAKPWAVPFALPPEVREAFHRYLDQWEEAARAGDEFRWRAEAPLEEVRWLVDYWVSIDSMTADQLAALGVWWSPPEGAPFFQALTTAVVEAMVAEEQSPFTDRLLDRWPPAAPGGGTPELRRQ